MKLEQKINPEKKRIFDIALILMNEKGFENLGIRDICKEANISVGKFYNYFESKQQLLTYFYRNVEVTFREQVIQSLKNLPVEEQLLKFYMWFNKYMASYGLEFVRNFFQSNNPVLNTHVYQNEIIIITDELLISAIQEGYKLPQGRTLHSISLDLCTIVKGIIFEWCVCKGDYDIEKETERLLKIIISALLK